MKGGLRVSEELSLPLDWITLSTVVYGARGSGKTTFGSVVAEEVYAQGQRFCAVDLKGDWWGLKAGLEDVGSGIPVVVFGGDHQDLPLEPDAGIEIANVIANLEQPSILDLEHLSKGKQLRFLAAFFERLYDANRDPILLLLDEAQRYAAQKPMSPDAVVCLGAVEDLVKLGRKHGIGPVLFTQRGSGLNKEVSELCDMLVAFRTPGSLDQDRVKDWLGANAGKEQAAEIMAQISGLPTGTAVFASNHPLLKISPRVVPVRMRNTYDSSATPKIGQRRREPKLLAKPDIEALREKMSEAIERAKAEDPKELRARIAILERELRDRPAEVTIEERIVEKIIHVDRPIVTPVDRKFLSDAVHDIQSAAETLIKGVNALSEAAKPKELPDKPAEIVRFPQRDVTPPPRQITQPARVPEQPRVTITPPDDAPTLTKSEKAFLGILAQYPQGRSKDQLALLAGYSAKSGGNYTTLASLRRREAISGTESLLQITEMGRALLGDDYEPLPTGDELRQYWLTHPTLSKGAKGFLRVLVEVYPGTVTKDELAERNGYSAKSGGNYTILADLRRRELITGTESALKASDELFST